MTRLTMTLIILFTFSISACKKDFLDRKSDKALVIPETLEDMQALLDADRYMNGSFLAGDGGPVPSLGEVGSDDYYIRYPDYQTYTDFIQKQSYVWAEEVYNKTVQDWNNPYRCVFYANNVLKGLEKVDLTTLNEDAWNNIKGSALFYRAHAFYHLAQVFAKQYDKNSASTDLGIPLKLTPDINEKVNRSSIQQTYDRIIDDLIEAKDLLPETPLYKTRPSKPAVFALLARTYLTMGEFEKAKEFSDSCLNLYNELLDYYDEVQYSTNTPFVRFNKEVIFHALSQNNNVFTSTTRGKIDTVLFNSYAAGDLRKAAFFRTSTNGTYRLKGSYDGTTQAFAGIATDEVYLIRAECLSRLGNITAAMDDLNFLLEKRWTKVNGVSTYVEQIATDANEALGKILAERRKELVFRSLRWIDLRRLNKEGANISLTRILDNQNYILEPNNNRWVFPIPYDVISLNPGMQQNPR